VVVDQHDPQRWDTHDGIVAAPAGWLKRVGFAVSGRICLGACSVTDNL
jgi:hypothetical protein